MKIAVLCTLFALLVVCNGRALEELLGKRMKDLNDFVDSNERELRNGNAEMAELLKWKNWVAVMLEWTDLAIEKIKSYFPSIIGDKFIEKLNKLKVKLLNLAELLDKANANSYAAVKKALEDVLNLWKALYNHFFWWAPILHFSLPTIPRSLPTRPFVATTAAAITDGEIDALIKRGILSGKLEEVIQRLINKVKEFLPELEKMPATQKIAEEARQLVERAQKLLDEWKQAVQDKVNGVNQLAQQKIDAIKNKLKEIQYKLFEMINLILFNNF